MERPSKYVRLSDSTIVAAAPTADIIIDPLGDVFWLSTSQRDTVASTPSRA